MPAPLHFIWFGSPRTKTISTPNMDTAGILSFVNWNCKHADNNKHPIYFWCMSEHVEYYRRLFTGLPKVEVLSYLSLLKIYPGEILTDHLLKERLELILTTLLVGKTSQAFVLAKDIFCLAVIYFRGGYFFDSTVYPNFGGETILPDCTNFKMAPVRNIKRVIVQFDTKLDPLPIWLEKSYIFTSTYKNPQDTSRTYPTFLPMRVKISPLMQNISCIGWGVIPYRLDLFLLSCNRNNLDARAALEYLVFYWPIFLTALVSFKEVLDNPTSMVNHPVRLEHSRSFEASLTTLKTSINFAQHINTEAVCLGFNALLHALFDRKIYTTPLEKECEKDLSAKLYYSTTIEELHPQLNERSRIKIEGLNLLKVHNGTHVPTQENCQTIIDEFVSMAQRLSFNTSPHSFATWLHGRITLV